MGDKTDIMDEILQLRLMYSIRDNMQSYYQGEKVRQMPEDQPNQLISDNIMSAYFALLKKFKSGQDVEKIERELVDYVYRETEKIEFNIDYAKFHTTDKKSDNVRQDDIEKTEKNNKLVLRLEKEIAKELECRREMGKTDIPQGFVPTSISIVKNEKDKEYFVINFVGCESPLKIPICTNLRHTQYGSSYALSGKIKGLGNISYKDIKEKGEILLTTQTAKDAGKVYTSSSYKRLSGLTDSKQIKISDSVLRD